MVPKMKPGERRDKIFEAMFNAANVAATTRNWRIFNRMMGIQADLQVALGLRKPEDAVCILTPNKFCPTCGRS